jgi:hypothetical protein
MQEGRRIDRKLGPSVLGAQMEMHSSLIASSLSLYSLWPYSFTVLSNLASKVFLLSIL